MESRQLDILRAIVEEYVATEEPVGSKAISQRHGLGISPATIRNEMSVLRKPDSSLNLTRVRAESRPIRATDSSWTKLQQ